MKKQQAYRLVLAGAFLAASMIAATAEARGGGGGRGMGGRAFSGGGPGRGIGDDRGQSRGDLGGGLGDDRLSGGLGAARDGLDRDGALAGDGPRTVADGARGEQQLQQFLGLPGGEERGAGLASRNANAAERRDHASQRANELRDNAQGWVNRFNRGNEPFSAGWYADHPNAWRYAHPNADAWAAASFAATTAWIGAAAYDDGGDDSTTVINEVPGDDVADSVDSSTAIAANVGDAGPGADGGDWLSLGVYALEPPAGGEKELMQLAVSRAGEIKGVYYNADDDLSENIAGKVDRTTQQAVWNVTSTPELQFSASLKTLTSPTGQVHVAAPNGVQQTWVTARLQQPQPAAAPTPPAPEEVIATP